MHLEHLEGVLKSSIHPYILQSFTMWALDENLSGGTVIVWEPSPGGVVADSYGLLNLF